jgi:maltose/moltooligosaccharide transporter
LLTNIFHVGTGTTGAHTIPRTVKISFYIGAAAFFGAVLWTVISTREYPPEDMEKFRRMKSAQTGILANLSEIFRSMAGMPQTMRRLAWVQIFTWLGLFCMWLYFPVAVARNVFGAPDETSPVYTRGVEWAGICFSMYSAVCFLFSFLLPALARLCGRKSAHSICLLCGAAGLISVAFIHDKNLLLLSMTGVGIAWSSILAMPYAILAGSLPAEKTGVYMGIFNFFIVIPEILASLALGWIMINILGNDRLAAVVAGGVFLVVASALVQRVHDPSP